MMATYDGYIWLHMVAYVDMIYIWLHMATYGCI